MGSFHIWTDMLLLMLWNYGNQNHYSTLQIFGTFVRVFGIRDVYLFNDKTTKYFILTIVSQYLNSPNISKQHLDNIGIIRR